MYPNTITIFNKTVIKGIEQFYPTIIKNVAYRDKVGVKTGTQVQLSENEGFIQIPKVSLQDYLPKEQWEVLTDKSTKWTTQDNIYVIKGEHSDKDLNWITKNGARLVKSYEVIDDGFVVDGHIGLYLV